MKRSEKRTGPTQWPEVLLFWLGALAGAMAGRSSGAGEPTRAKVSSTPTYASKVSRIN